MQKRISLNVRHSSTRDTRCFVLDPLLIYTDPLRLTQATRRTYRSRSRQTTKPTTKLKRPPRVLQQRGLIKENAGTGVELDLVSSDQLPPKKNRATKGIRAPIWLSWCGLST